MGDDCSVLRIPPQHDTLVTTDFSLEGIHFRREWHPAASVGHRCLTRGLSDIAAMGGDPLAVFLSLAIPEKLPQNWVNGFLRGFLHLADKYHVPLAGGDTSQSPADIAADIVVLGSVPKGQAVLRSGAQPGDRIFVTGELGGSAAIIALLYFHSRKKLKPANFSSHFFPVPRLKVGRMIRQQKIATAMIDISDGLSTDLSHLCEESGCGAEIWEDELPRAVIGRRTVDLRFALHGGEAYELLFTARERTKVPAKLSGVPVTCIGEITRRQKLALVHPDGSDSPLHIRGWQHFEQTSHRR
jgi:thiamine-monophosphate kinase